MPETPITSPMIPTAFPGAGVLTDVLTADRLTKVSCVAACNTGTATTVTIKVAPLGAADSDAHSRVYANPLAAGETKYYRDELQMSATDVLRVSSANGLVAFTVSAESVHTRASGSRLPSITF